jgi:hypothetical protein
MFVGYSDYRCWGFGSFVVFMYRGIKPEGKQLIEKESEKGSQPRLLFKTFYQVIVLIHSRCH